MNPLYKHISTLAREDGKRPVLIECDESGVIVREISRKESLQQIDAKIAGLRGGKEPLLIEGESRAEFLITCWAAWCAGRTGRPPRPTARATLGGPARIGRGPRPPQRARR